MQGLEARNLTPEFLLLTSPLYREIQSHFPFFFSRIKETCYPDIPDPYKSSILSLIKFKVNVGKLYVYHTPLKD